MNFSGGTMLRIALSLILALSAFSGAVAAADGQAPTPPTATSVALNTYGSLPVIVLNLTQLPINLNISAPNFGPRALPVAAGLPGTYYLNNGTTTATFSNILSPNITPNNSGASNSTYSLNPVASVDAQNNATFSTNSGWMSMFTVFPSWTANGTYHGVQYLGMGNPMTNQGAAAVNSPIVTGYPSSNHESISSLNAYALNAAQASVTTLKMTLLTPLSYGGVEVEAVYDININSLGEGTSGSVAIPSNGFSILKALHTVADLISDGMEALEGDPLAIIDLIDGVADTVNGIVTDVSNANSANVNVTTDKAYPAKSKGINVTATMDTSFSTATLTAYSGDSQSLMYETQLANASFKNPYLSPLQQNAVFVTTWRQSPQNNYGVTLPNGTDVLFVVVLNQGVYASNQVQQYINNNAPTQMAGGAKYQPTKAQAQDTAKILGILTAISKKNPQDAQLIIDLFGVHGKYGQIKNDPAAMKNLSVQLKTVFEKYKNELPAVEQYLTKLAQK